MILTQMVNLQPGLELNLQQSTHRYIYHDCNTILPTVQRILTFWGRNSGPGSLQTSMCSLSFHFSHPYFQGIFTKLTYTLFPAPSFVPSFLCPVCAFCCSAARCVQQNTHTENYSLCVYEFSSNEKTKNKKQKKLGVFKKLFKCFHRQEKLPI